MISGKIRMLAVVFVILLMVSLFAMPTVSADEIADTGSTETTGNNSSGTDKSALYQKYLESIAQYGYAKEDIVIDPF